MLTDTRLYNEVVFDKLRRLNSWIVADSSALMERFGENLRLAHLDVEDWFLTTIPLLVIPVVAGRKTGKLFEGIGLINPVSFPAGSLKVFCGNDSFMSLLSPDDYPIRKLLKLDKMRKVQQFVTWHYENGLHIVGVDLLEAKDAG